MQNLDWDGASPTRVGCRVSVCLEHAIEKLKSLHDGDRGLIEVVSCGGRAISALRALLFEREPSGLYQPRCRAVTALAALGAHDTLIEFLDADREIADPVERVGEDAVINAVALALADLREPRIFDLLLSLAVKRPLPGVIRALGSFGRAEAVPCLVEALAEDESRPAAEAALRQLGVLACQALAIAATSCAPLQEPLTESRLRQRRSALQLLSEIGIRPVTWPILRNLMAGEDSKIAVLACKICLANAPEIEKREAIFHLISLLPSADFVLDQQIEQCLASHFERAKELVAAALRAVEGVQDDHTRRVLQRVMARAAHVGSLATCSMAPAALNRTPVTIKARGQ